MFSPFLPAAFANKVYYLLAIAFPTALGIAILAVLLLGGVLLMMFRHWNREGDRWRERTEQLRARVAAMSLDEARLEANRVLGEPDAFSVSGNTGASEVKLQQLGPTTHDFFTTYSTVDAHFSGLHLEVHDLATSLLPANVIHIGRDVDTSALGVQPGNDEVMLFLEEYDPDEGPVLTFPSVYHYIVYKYRLHHV